MFCIFTLQASGKVDTYAYKEEFEKLAHSSENALVFDKDACVDARYIYRKVHNAKITSEANRFPATTLCPKGFLITEEIMPKMYSYIKGICDKHIIAVPLIFVTTQDSILNAFASKLLWFRGIVVLEKKLFSDCCDAEIEGVIAHELGHIKYGHVNKQVALIYVGSVVIPLAIEYCFPLTINRKKTVLQVFMDACVETALIGSLFAQLIIGKQFEKEADAFACQKVGKSEGMIQFFEKIQAKEQLHEKQFDDSYVHLKNSKNIVGWQDYYSILFSYYGINGIQKVSKWIYYNTRLGAHPSHKQRIAFAKACLDEQHSQRVAT